MPTFTTNRGYSKPTVGADVNAWGGELNADLDLLDQNLSQNVSIDITGGGAFDLTSDQAANLIIALTAPNTDNVSTVHLPAVGGFWIFRVAATVTGTNPVVRVIGNVGNPVVLNTINNIVYSDGTNVYRAGAHDDSP